MGSPENLRYTDDHEWARAEADGTITVGITDHAQEALGDVVFVDLPAIGRAVTGKGTIGVVESVKTVSDVYAPCNGEVVAVNEALRTNPENVNKDCYGEGWIARIRPSGDNPLAHLKNAADYDVFVAASH